jgi:trehalose 6-phosphate synthase/phosphatase
MVVDSRSSIEKSLAFVKSQIREKPGTQFLLLLDYDGTLVPIVPNPADAQLSAEVEEELTSLCEIPGVRVLIVSGRERHFLQEQCGSLAVELAAEHGALFFDRRAGSWTELCRSDPARWMETARSYLQELVRKLPGSFMEEKEFSAVWHYRNVPTVGEDEIRRFAAELRQCFPENIVQVQQGKKMLEVRALEANKGRFVDWFLASTFAPASPLALMCIGDDKTDEDMFAVVRRYEGCSLKVGQGESVAELGLASQGDVLPWLRAIRLALLR